MKLLSIIFIAIIVLQSFNSFAQDFGRTWKPIFDDQPTGSIGDKDLALQYDLSLMCYNNMQKCMNVLKATDGVGEGAAEFRKELNTGFRNFSSIQNILQDSDMPPTKQIIEAAKRNGKRLCRHPEKIYVTKKMKML